jgi:hypothetical protein
MESLSVRCACPLALSLLLAVLGCTRETMGFPGGAGGSVNVAGGRGGRGGTGGTSGRGGATSSGGTSGTTGGGGATSSGGTSGTTGGSGDGSSEAGEAGGEVADAAEAGTPDVPMAEVAPMPDMVQPDMPIVPGGCGNYVAAANTTGGAEGLVVTPDDREPLVLHTGEIGPGAEVPRGSRQHDDPTGRGLDGPSEGGERLEVDGVAPLRTIERDECDRASFVVVDHVDRSYRPTVARELPVAPDRFALLVEGG